jgi:hypothetical protein
VLGAGWSTYAEPGSAENGTIGNGSWVQQRQIGDVMDGLTPIGCPARAVSIRLTRPVWALEGTYRGPRQAPGIGLVLEFADPAKAAQFLDRLRKQVQACPAPRGAVDKDGPLVLTFVSLPSRPGTVSAVRKEYGFEADPNRYLLVAAQRGRRVGMLYLAGAPPDRRGRIAGGLMAAITREGSA